MQTTSTLEAKRTPSLGRIIAIVVAALLAVTMLNTSVADAQVQLSAASTDVVDDAIANCPPGEICFIGSGGGTFRPNLANWDGWCNFSNNLGYRCRIPEIYTPGAVVNNTENCTVTLGTYGSDIRYVIPPGWTIEFSGDAHFDYFRIDCD